MADYLFPSAAVAVLYGALQSVLLLLDRPVKSLVWLQAIFTAAAASLTCASLKLAWHTRDLPYQSPAQAEAETLAHRCSLAMSWAVRAWLVFTLFHVLLAWRQKRARLQKSRSLSDS